MLKPANVAILKASVLPIFLEAAYQGNPWVEVDFTEGILSWTKQCSVHIFTGHCNLDEVKLDYCCVAVLIDVAFCLKS